MKAARSIPGRGGFQAGLLAASFGLGVAASALVAGGLLPGPAPDVATAEPEAAPAEAPEAIVQAEVLEPPAPEPAPPPPVADIPQAPALATGGEVRVRRGEALVDLLLRQGLPAEQAHEAVQALRQAYDPHRLRAGQTVTVGLADDGASLASLSLDADAATVVRLTRSPDGTFAARSVSRPVHRDTVRVAAEIEDSLYNAARRVGLPGEALGELVKVLSWDVDFQRDLQPGDRLEVVLERTVNDRGQLVRSEGVAYAALELQDRRIEAYRFQGRDGRAGYFDGEGRALRKSLLRTPVDGARISSPFGMRFHPILGYSRMHKGVDFAAPTGTPVFAAGDGVVEFAGRNHGYGNYVRLRHNGDYGTAYGHLWHFAKGIAPGTRVAQGEVIGYVGATGLATGPHLHYEILKDGTQINPQGLKLAFADRLDGADLRRFRQLKAQIDAQRGGEPVVAEASQ